MGNSHIQYAELYDQYAEKVCQGCPDAMNAPRAEAEAFVRQNGLPTHRTERYKYTDANEAFAPDFGLNIMRRPVGTDPYTTFKCNVPNLSTALFFVVNDTPCEAPANVRSLLPEGVIVDSFRRVAESRPELIANFYNRAAQTDRDFPAGHDGVTMLNTLLAQDGLLIYLPKGVALKQPIQVVNVTVATSQVMCVRRVLLIAEDGASGSVLFCDHTDGAQPCLTTQVIEVFANKHANLGVYSIEETSAATTRFSTLYAEQQEGSRLSYDGISLTCGRTRNRLDVRLRGEDATTELYGAAIADASQRVDNNIIVEHLAPKCTSDMLYKYVLNGESVGAFAGKVYVAPGAQQTASQQTNANICAAPTARAFSQPMLEIYADDVKCNHGSTIGKLDETALFYMRQRGIPEQEARLMLQHAFINDVLRHIHIDHLHERLSHLVEQRFRGALGSQCQACRGCGRK